MIELKTPEGRILVSKSSVVAVVEKTPGTNVKCHIYVLGSDEPFNILNSYVDVCLALGA